MRLIPAPARATRRAECVGGENHANQVNWILDADISKFFDTVNYEWLIRFQEHRIGDARVIRLIRKWPQAGVMQEGLVKATEEGTPQGAVISPLPTHISNANRPPTTRVTG